jgi:serine protease Do
MKSVACVVRATGVWCLFMAALAAPAVGADAAAADREILRAMSRAVSRLAAEARPTVVSVYTTRTVRMRQGGPSPFDEFFGPRAPRGRQPKERKYRQRGLGSGFIIDATKGYVVTNNHVIEGADDIKVRLSDKREFDGKLIGADAKTDIAVVQIEAKDLKSLKMGDSDKLAVGDFVVAIGSPFGLRETVSLGIVSAKGRSNLGIEAYEDFIQTDAAINVGNSGGPLVDVNGEVVGVNTAILSRTGGSVGVGFAIPINMTKNIIAQLIKSGKVTRGWLGVMIQDLTPELAEKLGIKETRGALVTRVVEGTPAAKAGLKPGDLIIKYGAKDVENVAKLRSHVAATTPESSVGIVVVRDGKKTTLTAKIEKLTDSAVAGVSGGGSSKELGLSVQDLTPELAKTLGIKTASGVVVSQVEGAGPAAEKGIKNGDVIIEVNRRRVKTAGEFEAALKKADLKKGVLLLVANREGTRFVVLKVDDKK